MSEIKSFSDYTSKYNSNVDYSALFGGTSDSSSVGNTNMLSDYAAIKNGSYGKLMKAYYAKQDAEKLSGKGDTSQKLTLMKTSADSLKKSADALNDASLWGKKKIKKKDEKTGEETEVEDYDWDAITKKVKSFIDDYNDVVKEAGESNTKDVLRNASWMTGMTDKTSHLLSKIGITMIIDSSNVGMASSRTYSSAAVYQTETMNAKSEQAVLLDLSDESKTLMEQMKDIKNQQEEEKSQKQKQNMEDLLKNGIVGTKKSEQGTIQAKSKEEMKLNIKPTIVKPMRYPVSISEGELHPA